MLGRLVAMMIATFAVPCGAQVPQFRDFPAVPYSGARTALRLTKQDMTFRTRLRDAATQPANFAGHYVLTTWGCGMSCQMGAAIDLQSGRVVWLPGTVCCEPTDVSDDKFERVLGRLNSRLVVLSGLINEGGSQGAHFFMLEDGKFIHLADAPFTLHPAPH